GGGGGGRRSGGGGGLFAADWLVRWLGQKQEDDHADDGQAAGHAGDDERPFVALGQLIIEVVVGGDPGRPRRLHLLLEPFARWLAAAGHRRQRLGRRIRRLGHEGLGDRRRLREDGGSRLRQNGGSRLREDGGSR